MSSAKWRPFRIGLNELRGEGVAEDLKAYCTSSRKEVKSINKHTWWRDQMETLSALLTICAGNSPITGEFTAQRPVTRCFDVFFDTLLNKRLSKQRWGWWFETPSRPLWRHCNDIRENRERVKMYIYDRILWFCYDLVLPNFTYISNVTMAIAQSHYSDVIMCAMASQITCVSIVCSTVFFQAKIKENIKVPRHWPLWGESTSDPWIPLMKVQ